MLKFEFNNEENALPLPSEDEAMLQLIEQRIDAESDLSPAYKSAIEELRQCYPFESRKRDHQGIILCWPVKVSGEFFAAAVERRTMAVAILAYYGTLLHALRNVWWAGDKGKVLVEAASWLLPPEWESVVRWARIQVGLDDHP
jgi:hypothetical protein